jgi:hypothetical protein
VIADRAYTSRGNRRYLRRRRIRAWCVFEGALAIGGDANLRVVPPDGMHPLLGAIGRAFAEHRPIVLSPDAVWLTIAQGVAQHVRLHAEELRPLPVNHSGRRRLTVEIGGPMPHDAASWRCIYNPSMRMAARSSPVGPPASIRTFAAMG